MWLFCKVHIDTRTHKSFLVKGLLWHTSMYVFDKPFHATSHIYAHFLKGSLCYLLTNIHILKGIFTLPIQHIQILKGIFLLYIHTLCKAFSRYIFTYIHTIEGFFLLIRPMIGSQVTKKCFESWEDEMITVD